LLHIVLAGQPATGGETEIATNLAQLRQRLSVVVELAPFTLNQDGPPKYINHRLKVAGFTKDNLSSRTKRWNSLPTQVKEFRESLTILFFIRCHSVIQPKKRIIDLPIVHEAARSPRTRSAGQSTRPFGPVSTHSMQRLFE